MPQKLKVPRDMLSLTTRRNRSKQFADMTATKIIEEIAGLSPNDRALVVEYVHRVEDAEMPASFLEALGELRDGKTIPMEDAHFDAPPA